MGDEITIKVGPGLMAPWLVIKRRDMPKLMEYVESRGMTLAEWVEEQRGDA